MPRNNQPKNNGSFADPTLALGWPYQEVNIVVQLNASLHLLALAGLCLYPQLMGF
jgi:hypothetical protein